MRQSFDISPSSVRFLVKEDAGGGIPFPNPGSRILVKEDAGGGIPLKAQEVPPTTGPPEPTTEPPALNLLLDPTTVG